MTEPAKTAKTARAAIALLRASLVAFAISEYEALLDGISRDGMMNSLIAVSAKAAAITAMTDMLKRYVTIRSRAPRQSPSTLCTFTILVDFCTCRGRTDLGEGRVRILAVRGHRPFFPKFPRP